MRNNIRRNFVAAFGVLLFITIINIFCYSNSTYATIDFNDTINYKALLEDVVLCYQNYNIFEPRVTLYEAGSNEEFSTYGNLFADKELVDLGMGNQVYMYKLPKEPTIPFPVGDSNFEFPSIHCNPELFIGYDGRGTGLYAPMDDDGGVVEGLPTWTGKTELQNDVSIPPDRRAQLLYDLGYVGTGPSQLCSYFLYERKTGTNNPLKEGLVFALNNLFTPTWNAPIGIEVSQVVCYDKTSKTFVLKNTNWHNAKYYGIDLGVKQIDLFDNDSNGSTTLKINGQTIITADEAETGWNVIKDEHQGQSNICQLINAPEYQYIKARLDLYCYIGDKANDIEGFSLVGGSWYTDSGNYVFDALTNQKIDGITITEQRALRYFSGNDNMIYSDLAFTPDEQLTYIYKALRYYIFEDKDVDNYQRCDLNTSNISSYTMIGIDLNTGEPNENCGIRFDDQYVRKDGSNARLEFPGFGDDSNPVTKDHFGYTTINKSNITQIIKDLLARGAQVTDTAQNTGNWCLDSGAAGNLGYVLCNVLQLASSATTELYNSAVKPMLKIDPQLFTEPTQTVRQVWGTIRTIANIIFIILFLFVIFSQLTGIGIDNYGIKKALPKIIVAAILINLSYVICTAFIDLSNILGNGIQDLFNSLVTDVGTTGPSGANVGVDVVVGLVGLIAAGTFIGAAFMNPAILVGLLVAVLGVLISICFLFILLAMRQGAVVVLTVVSPIAFALYILPNSKKIFDKWLKAGEGMLLLYPICGALVAGGNFISRLLLSTGFAGGSFWAAIAAMAIGIAPIFFIPKVLKSSFAALGNIGAAVSNLGARLRSGATGKIKGSEGYQNLQKVGQRRRTRIKAGLDKEGKLTGVGKLKARFASTGVGKTLYGKTFNDYNKAARKIREEDIEAASNVSAALASADLANKPDKQPVAVYREKLEIAVKKGASSNELYSIIDAAKSAGLKDKDIAAITRAVFDGDSLDYMGKNKSNFLREYGNRYAGSFLKKDFQQKAWSLGGGMDKNGNKTTLSSHTVKIGDMTDEEVGDLSKENFERLYNSGAISAVQAGRVYDANKGEDDVMRHMLYTAKTGGTVSVGFSEGEVRGGGDEIKKILRRSATRVVLDNDAQGNTAQNNNSPNSNTPQGNTQPPTPTGDSGDIQLR